MGCGNGTLQVAGLCALEAKALAGSGLKGLCEILNKTSILNYVNRMDTGAFAIVTFNIYDYTFNSWTESLRYAVFQVISLGTSTGFAPTDSTIWLPFAQLVMIFFTMQCACAGSTSGGIKVDRIVVFWKGLLRKITMSRYPHAVITPKIDGVAIDSDILEAGLLYISLYIGIIFVSSIVLTALGVDILSSFSGSAATMGNVGPGFGMVGSVGNFSKIPDAGKWVLTLTMLLGRLEIFGLILLITVRSWK